MANKHRYVRFKRYAFSAFWVLHRLSMLAILVSNRAWFLHLSLELYGYVFRRGTNYKTGLKQGIDQRVRI